MSSRRLFFVPGLGFALTLGLALGGALAEPTFAQYPNNNYQPQPQYQYNQGGQNYQSNQGGGQNATDPALLKQWFSRYDAVRRQAQMTPREKEQADGLLSKGLSMFVPGDEKLAGQKLLTGLVSKYNVAINQMKGLPLYPETSQLHRGYYQYFNDAKNLFSDYLLVQNDPLAKDPRTGERLLGKIVTRKASLTDLEGNIKNLDNNLRNQIGVPPYRY